MRRHFKAITVTLVVALVPLVGFQSSATAATQVNLRVLTGENPPLVAYFKSAIPAFEKRYPNIKVQFGTIPTAGTDGITKDRLIAKAVDVLTINAGSVPPSYVTGSTLSNMQILEKAGAFVDQSKQGYVSRWLPKIVASATQNGKIFYLPLGSNIVNGIFYNKTMFKKYGLSVPTTWSEFMNVNKTLTSNGVTPLAIGGKDVWPAGLVMLGMVQSLYPNMDALNKGLWDHSIKLTDPTSVKVLTQIQDVFKYTEPTFPGLAYSNVYGEFLNGKVAMIPDGGWAEPSIAQGKPSFGYGYFPLPGSEKAADNVFGLKPEYGFAVSSRSSKAQQDAAFKWIDYFSLRTNYSKFINATSFIPVSKSPILKPSPFLKGLTAGLKNATTEWEYHYFYNPKSAPGVNFPFDYTKISPLGSETDMNALAAELQKLLVQGQAS